MILFLFWLLDCILKPMLRPSTLSTNARSDAFMDAMFHNLSAQFPKSIVATVYSGFKRDMIYREMCAEATYQVAVDRLFRGPTNLRSQTGERERDWGKLNVHLSHPHYAALCSINEQIDLYWLILSVLL